MIFEQDCLVYFDDQSSLEEIKLFFKKIVKQEADIKKNIIIPDGQKPQHTQIINVIQYLNNLNAISISDEQKNEIIKILNNEQNKQIQYINNFYDKKFCSLFALIDFVSRNNSKFNHTINKIISSAGDMVSIKFSGPFQYEFNYLSTIFNNIIFLTFVKPSTSDTIPNLTFEKPFEQTLDIIKNHFLTAAGQLNFDRIFSIYQKYIISNSLNNSNNTTKLTNKSKKI